VLKVVIDTSVWLSGIFWHGIPHRILDAWKAGDFEAVVSEKTLAELERKLAEKVAEFGAEPGIVEEWITLISEEAFLVEPRERIHACRDADDDRFLEAATAGQAAFIVSGDKDLTDMARFRDVEIVTPRQFLNHLLSAL
jgi:putative PIN family toxin of toxin-antitoxin system